MELLMLTYYVPLKVMVDMRIQLYGNKKELYGPCGNL
jgi:hypothetical protein